MTSADEEKPRLVVLFSGKRKSGKDHLTDALQETLSAKNVSSVNMRLSGPIKEVYAKEHGLDFEELMSSGPMKEQHRSSMIAWSESQREKDPGVFCRAAKDQYGAVGHSVWLVGDCRRKSDLAYFQSRYECLTARIWASESTRAKRGWKFQAGVDDAESECGLDDVQHWDLTVQNDLDGVLAKEVLKDAIEKILEKVK